MVAHRSEGIHGFVLNNAKVQQNMNYRPKAKSRQKTHPPLGNPERLNKPETWKVPEKCAPPPPWIFGPFVTMSTNDILIRL